METGRALLLEDRDRHRLDGGEGELMQFAMQVILRAAEASGADRLVDISFAHIDACFYGGQTHLDFCRYLTQQKARFAVPTWTNASLICRKKPELRPEAKTPGDVRGASELMDLYQELGCLPVWTCAPYLLPDRPQLGDQIVGSESNAVTFYNSVLGARTNKYGDFYDVCAALTGRVPLSGLHMDAGRCGRILFRLEDVPDELLRRDIFYHVLGHLVGRESQSAVPVIEGLPDGVTEDQLKAVSAAVAASGGVSLFHAVGITPEAPTREAAFQGGEPEKIIAVGPDNLLVARQQLSTSAGNGPVNMVALGTPHFSFTEFEALFPLMEGRKVHPDVRFYVTTNRYVRERIRQQGWLEVLESSGVEVVVDTCTYFTPVVSGCQGRVMTNSAKWAYYAPGMLGVEVLFGGLEDCVNSAASGRVVRDERLWRDSAWGRGA